MCREHTQVFEQSNSSPVLTSDKFSKYLCIRKEKGFKKFSQLLCQQSQAKSVKMTSALYRKYSSTQQSMSFANSLSRASVPKSCKHFSGSTDVCPYCRSVRCELEDNKINSMCSQSSNCHNVSLSTQQSYCLNDISQLQNFSGPCAGHVPTDLCRCAKNISIVRSSSTTRANYCSSNDGWRALRLVLLGILVVLPTSTMSSPVKHHSQRSGSPHSSGHHSHHSPHRGNERPMKWINPCRIPSSQPPQTAMAYQTDEEIYQNILTQSKKAEIQARRFFEDFREECFGKTGHDFKQLHYDWLNDVAQKVDKSLGEPVSQSRLESMEVEDILRSMYRGLQKLAVGLEQVVLDQALHGGSFYQHFHEAEFQLKYVLCEFQIAMMEKHIQYEDITREIMDRRFINLEDKTWRNFRDFSIFRDYLNTLEFIKDSFNFFWKRAKTDRR